MSTLLAALTAARGKADESCSDGYALGLKQRAEELAANKRLLDAAHAALTAARVERDRLWCAAAVRAFSVENVHLLMQVFNAMRPDPEALATPQRAKEEEG